MPNELGAFITAEVARAETDFQGARTRATSVLGIAGALVTLVTGFLALAAGSHKDVLTPGSRTMLMIALASFILSAVLALMINLPSRAIVSDEESLKTNVAVDWEAEGWEQRVGEMMVEYLGSLRKANAYLARLLIGTLFFEIAGVVCLATAGLIVIKHLPG